MKKAPSFELRDQDNQLKTLNDYSGKWLVLYFYPKDETPGCTLEACQFRDARDDIAKLKNVALVGISKDSVSSHKKFSEKHNLNFTLLSDPDRKAIQDYGCLKSKKMFGKEVLGTLRNTFIIDPNGLIVKEYIDVDPKSHYQQIIQDLSHLM